jgi:hypothetical protein
MAKKTKAPAAIDQIDTMIRTIRGTRVMLDRDLAQIYGVPTKVFNQAVKRNAARFPEDFMFRLIKEEAEGVRVSGSQIVTLKRGQNVKYLPLRIHRIRCIDGRKYPDQPTRRSDEHLCCSGVRQNARGAPGKSPACQETRCARKKADFPIGRARGGHRASSARSNANSQSPANTAATSTPTDRIQIGSSRAHQRAPPS